MTNINKKIRVVFGGGSIMSTYLNLKQIVKQVRKVELGIDNSEDRFKKLYDHDNEHLLEVLRAVNFSVELLKLDGEYHIPQEDCEFIQWILEHYTDSDMKLIRRGEFVKADLEFQFRLISGLNNIMKNLQINDDIRGLQIEKIHEKTDYHIQVRIWNTQVELWRMLNDVAQYMKQPMFNLTSENRIEYLDEVFKLTKAYSDAVRQSFTDILKKREEKIKSCSFPVTLEEMEFSEKSQKISAELSENKEYIKICKELKNMKQQKGFLNKYEKKYNQYKKKTLKIFREIAEKYTIDVDKMTKIEKIMCLANSPFIIRYRSESREWYVTFDVDSSTWKQIDSVICE